MVTLKQTEQLSEEQKIDLLKLLIEKNNLLQERLHITELGDWDSAIKEYNRIATRIEEINEELKKYIDED